MTYPKKDYCLMVNGQLVRDSKGLPYRCSKQVAMANVKARREEGKSAEMLKIGKDIELGKD